MPLWSTDVSSLQQKLSGTSIGLTPIKESVYKIPQVIQMKNSNFERDNSSTMPRIYGYSYTTSIWAYEVTNLGQSAHAPIRLGLPRRQAKIPVRS